MKVAGFFALCLIAITLAATAQTIGWRDAQGNAVPDTPYKKSKDGLGGWLLITGDTDWESKWNTPADNIPHFNEPSTVKVGETVFSLILISNPAKDTNGNVNILCDLEITRPDGSKSTNQIDVPCMVGELPGDPLSIYMAEQVAGFLGEPSDPVGTWTVRVRLKDMVRNTTIELEKSFTFSHDV
jgi:hypothetical protein